MPTKHRSYIPMSSEGLPQQHITEVVDVPAKPYGLQVNFSAGSEYLDGKRLGTPRNVEFLCSVEWAWGPAHGRIDNYYINKKRKHWALWNNWMDDNDYAWRWHWTMIAHAPYVKADELAVAAHLLIETWKHQKEWEDLDQYHWINNDGLLETSMIAAIGRQVWE